MATLSKIRSHGVLLLIVVGLAMLAFILGDFLNSGSSFFNRGRENIAVISGNKINFRDFERSKEELTEFFKTQNQNISDEIAQQQIREQVWQWYISENTLGEEAKTVGLHVTEDEIEGNIYQICQNIQDPALAQAYQFHPTYRNCLERMIRNGLIQQKYSSLLRNLIHANSLDAKFAFNARQADVNVEYVCKPYYAIPDSLVKVSSSDIKKLYNLYKEAYKQEPYRMISYVAFDIVPSETDYKEAEELMKGLQEEFKTTENITSFVNSYSNIPFYSQDYSEATIPAQYKDFAFAKGAKAGQVTELSFENNVYSMARIVKAGYSLPDSVEIQMIVGESETQEQQPIWYQTSALKEQLASDLFEKICNSKKGEQIPLPAADENIFLKIVDKSPATPKVQLAILERRVIPSSNTTTALSSQIVKFISDNNTEEKFIAAAKEQDLNYISDYRLTKNTENVGSLGDSRRIVQWAFEAKEGEISDLYRCDEQYIVAILTEASDDEYRSINDVRAQLTIEAMNNKKAELLMNDAEEVQSLEQAAELFGTEIQTAEHINFASYRFGNSGAEPAVIGTALAMADNTIAGPIQGNFGVYYIKTGVKVTATNEIDLEAEKSQLTQRNFGMMAQYLMSEIISKANIKDNRINFY